MLTVGSVGNTFGCEGLLMENGKPIDRNRCISVVGCTPPDFDYFMIKCGQGECRNGNVYFNDSTKGNICLFCLKQKYKFAS